jgi:non-specific serine/threonine protein kinase
MTRTASDWLQQFRDASAADPSLDLRRWASGVIELLGDPDMLGQIEALVRSADSGTLPVAVPTERLQAPAPSSASSGQLVPGHALGERFRIVSKVGDGGMGEVYLADDLVLGGPVAIKLLSSALTTAPGGFERLVAEVRLAREVSHPNVARVHDIGRFDGHSVLSMEFIEGESLDRLMRRIGRAPREKATQIGLELAGALREVHRKGIVHRDLKPANVMLDGEGRVRLADFGLAVTVADSAGSRIAGTPAYMAPEQLDGHPPTSAADVYAFGLLMAELFTGIRLAKGRSLDDVRRWREAWEPERALEALSRTAPRVASRLLSTLDEDPRRRPGAEELERAFGQELDGAPVSGLDLEEGDPATGGTNLPPVSGPMVGRGAELEAAEEALADHSIVSLVGSGGSGKTRLALELGTRILAGVPGGVWWVELASLVDPALVAQHMASTLGLQLDAATSPLEGLVGHLSARPALLILDNCEHLIEEVARLAGELTRRCPELRLIATSQEPLDVTGEGLVRLEPMVVPGPKDRLGLEEAMGIDAVALFEAHAVAAHPGFRLEEGNLPSVVELCRRLDGNPLAIKLAAARAGMLSAEEILDRLDRRFQLLKGGQRGDPGRQRSLLGAVEWSHGLLSDGEREVFRRIGVFSGSFDLAAAEAVAWVEDPDPWARLDEFTRLVDRSLLVAEHQPGGGVRYRLLETLRAYALDRLEEAGDAAEVRRRHREYYSELAMGLLEADGGLDARGQGRLDQEIGNLRVALDPEGPEDLETSLRLAGALANHWSEVGLWEEAVHHLEHLLSRDMAGVPLEFRVELMMTAGILLKEQGRYDDAETLLSELHELGAAAGDQRVRRRALAGLGNIAEYRGRYDDAEARYQECLELSGDSDARIDRARALGNLGNVANGRGDQSRAREYFLLAMADFEEEGQERAVAACLNNLLACCLSQRDLEAARTFGERSLAIRERLGDRVGASSTLQNLAALARMQGELEEARRRLRLSMETTWEVGARSHLAGLLEEHAKLLVLEGDAEAAARCLFSAEALRKELGASLGEDSRADLEELEGRVHEALGAAAIERLRNESDSSDIELRVRELLAAPPE